MSERTEFLAGYSGESMDELLALEDNYRIDSLVLAIEQALEFKSIQHDLIREERYVLAIEAFEREVNNGGYGLFLINSSNEHAGIIVEALQAIGCHRTARITSEAIVALGIAGEITASKVAAALETGGEALVNFLEICDDRFFMEPELIAENLFAWIKQNRASNRIPS